MAGLMRTLGGLGAVVALAVGLTGGASPAMAQFVCGGSTTGAEPQSGVTAQAGLQGVSCGSGAGLGNTGVGGSFFGFNSGFLSNGNTNSAIGYNAGEVALGSSNVAVGAGAGSANTSSNAPSPGRVTTSNNVAVGTNSGQDIAGGGFNTAVGDSAGITIRGGSNSAFGSAAGTNVTGNDNTATGNGAGFKVTGNLNTASGFFAGNNVTGSENVAIGPDAGRALTGSSNIAIGSGAGGSPSASAPLAVNDSISLGFGAVAQFDNSVAVGTAVSTTRVNQQSFGLNSSNYTFAGLGVGGAAHGTAMQTGARELVTTDGSGNLGTSTPTALGLASSAQVASLQSQINVIADQDKKLATGIAVSVAMAGAPTLLPWEKFAVTGNWGNYGGEDALGFNGAVKVNQNLSFNAGFGVGLGDSQVASRAGFRFGF